MATYKREGVEINNEQKTKLNDMFRHEIGRAVKVEGFDVRSMVVEDRKEGQKIVTFYRTRDNIETCLGRVVIGAKGGIKSNSVSTIADWF